MRSYTTILVARCSTNHSRSSTQAKTQINALAKAISTQEAATGAKALMTANAMTMKRYVISRMGMALVR